MEHLNINFIRQKFDTLLQITTGNINILTILDTKFDKSFPNGHFLIKGFSEQNKFNQNSKGAGMLLIAEDIPFKLYSIENSS